jgi:hypothetical protein
MMTRFSDQELERFVAQARPVRKEHVKAERQARLEIIRMKRLMRKERLRPQS